MKITFDWLKDHLTISAKEERLIEKLTDIGLEVEGLHIDKNINMGHLKGCLNYFIKEFFEVDKIKMDLDQVIFLLLNRPLRLT